MTSPAPFHDKNGPAPDCFWITASDGVRLRAGHWRAAQPRGTVLIFTGRTEYLEKYHDTALFLTRSGYDVLSVDWRGQGLSDPAHPSPPRNGHIDDFAEYQTDVAALTTLAHDKGVGPWHVLAHSMGGAIALRALSRGLPVATASFSAPMWGINLAPLSEPAAFALARMMRGIGAGRVAVPGQGAGQTYVTKAPFDGNALTSDPQAWAAMAEQARACPHLTLGPPTFGWITAALAECRALRRLTPPDLPTLIAVGRNETVVSVPAIRDLAARWPSARVLDTEARHEILQEHPDLRRTFLDAVLAHMG